MSRRYLAHGVATFVFNTNLWPFDPECTHSDEMPAGFDLEPLRKLVLALSGVSDVWFGRYGLTVRITTSAILAMGSGAIDDLDATLEMEFSAKLNTILAQLSSDSRTKHYFPDVRPERTVTVEYIGCTA